MKFQRLTRAASGRVSNELAFTEILAVVPDSLFEEDDTALRKELYNLIPMLSAAGVGQLRNIVALAVSAGIHHAAERTNA